MRTQWFQNKKVLKLINIAQIVIILVWLGYLFIFTRLKYRVVGFFIGSSYPGLWGLPIRPSLDSPEHLICKVHFYISLPIILLYRIWVYPRLNSSIKNDIRNPQFRFISLITLLFIQLLTQFLLFRKTFIIVDETSYPYPVYITRVEYNGSFANLEAAAIIQIKILFITGGILYLALFLSTIKMVIIQYIRRKKDLKKNMKEILTDHENLMTDLKN